MLPRLQDGHIPTFLNTRGVTHVLSVVNINQLEAFVGKKWQSPL